MLEHLVLKCHRIPLSVKDKFKALEAKKEKKRKEKQEYQNVQMAQADEDFAEAKKRATNMRQTGLKAGFQAVECHLADHAIAKFFYANGLPFRVARPLSGGRSLYYEMVRAIQAAPRSYVPPNLNKLAGPLLDDVYSQMWRDLEARDPAGAFVKKFGATYVSDGWESAGNVPLINSAFISAADGGVYWRSVDTSGKIKDGEYTASLMIEDVYDFGPTKVVLIVTDTCATMKKAWDIVMQEFPWISVVPCQPHVASLLMKDLGKIPMVDSLIKEEFGYGGRLVLKSSKTTGDSPRAHEGKVQSWQRAGQGRCHTLRHTHTGR